jgi:hypothetical protein
LVLGLGACLPTDPGCEFADSCGDVDELGRATERRKCINLCQETAPPDLVAGNRAACRLDPCDTSLTDPGPVSRFPGVFACPDNHRCERNAAAVGIGLGDGFGTCQPTDERLWQPCDSTAEVDTCEDGTFCAPPSSPRVQELVSVFGLEASDGLCIAPVREGSLCDTNIVDPRKFTVDGSGERGSRACEEGTFCVRQDRVFGTGSEPEFRCTRPCADDAGLPDDGLCACGRSLCFESASGPLQDPQLGDLGQYFCSPCLGNGEECAASPFECCDSRSVCRAVPGVHEGEAATTECCWGDSPIGTETPDIECDPLGINGCCTGTICSPQTLRCEVCGLEGEALDEGELCCDDLVPSVGLDGQLRCVSCPTGGCSGEFFIGDSIDGEDSEYVLNSQSGFWFDHEPQPIGGNFVDSGRGTTTFVYQTDSDRLPYIFGERLLEEGLPREDAGRDFFALPTGTRVVPRAETIAEGDWTAARLYDRGSCSIRLTWNVIAQNLIRQTIAGLAGSQVRDLVHLSTQLTPEIESEARYPATMPRGFRTNRDHVRIRTEIEGEHQGVCGFVGLVLNGEVGIETAHGFNVTAATLAADAAMAEVSCRRVGLEYECQEPVGTRGDGVPIIGTVRYGLPASGEILFEDHQLEEVGCFPQRDDYVCPVYPGSTSGAGGPLTSLAGFRFEGYRPVDFVAYSKDILGGVDSVDAEISSCVDVILERALESRVRSEAPDIAGAVAEILSALLGSSATADAGVPATDLPVCATDQDCRVRSWRGMRRNGCGFTSAGFRCDRLRYEPRRINVRPDGLEVVLAESPSDPQYDLLVGRMAGLDPICGDLRPVQFDREMDTFEQLSIDDTEVGVLRVCNPDELGCTGICPSVGTECLTAAFAGLAPPGSTCNAERCCTAASVCDGECRDLNNDEAHCGDCGSACAPGQLCAGGSCIVP